MEQEFTEISELRESDKSLKHELGSVKDPVSHTCVCRRCGSILVSYTRSGWVAGLSPFTVMANIFVTEFSENI